MISFLLGPPAYILILSLWNHGQIYWTPYTIATGLCLVSSLVSLIAFALYWVQMAGYGDRLRHGSGQTPTPPVARRLE